MEVIYPIGKFYLFEYHKRKFTKELRMNKKFVKFFENYGLTTNGKFAYGTIKGYETNATLIPLDNTAPLRIHISFYATDAQKQAMAAAIRNLALKFFRMEFSTYGLTLGFNGFTLGSLLKRLPEHLDKIYAIISENGALTSEFCPVCGNQLQEENLKKCNIDGYTITIDNDCVNTINTVIDAENEDFNNAPNNYLKGFAGALIGGLVGVALSVVLYIVGFVSALSAVVAIALGAFLYQKFHGKPNKMMIVIVSLTTFVLLAATIPATYIIAAGIKLKDFGFSAIEAFQFVMEDAEFARAFYTDLALVALFSAIGIGLQIFVLLKRIKRKKNI